MIAPSSSVAVERLGSIPFWRKRSITSVAVEPTGSNVARTGTVVSIEPMWWWSRISTISACSTPGTLCACSAWSTSSTRRGAGSTRSVRVTRPIGLRGGVDGDRRAVVDLLDLVGDVGEQVVGADGQRLRVHQRAARRRQRDHAARSRRCPAARDDRDPALARPARASSSRRASCRCSSPAARRRARSPRAARPRGCRRRRRRPAPISLGSGRCPSPSPHRGRRPRRPRRRPCSPSSTSTIALDRASARPARRLARLADVAAGERALGHHAGQRAVLVDDRHEVEVLARHHAGRPRAPARRRRQRELARASRRARAASRAARNSGSRRAGALEHPARLRVEVAEAHRHVLVVADRGGPSARRSRRRRRSSPCPGCDAR